MAAQTISGTVFEDVNYGGGAGRPLSGTAGAAPVGRLSTNGVPGSTTASARVELYDANGLFVSFTSTSTASTAALGTYSFSGLTIGATYTVRVVNSSVRSTRTGSANGLLPVQTFAGGATDRVGGADPARADAGNGGTGVTLTNLDVPTSGGTVGTVPQSVVAVTVAAGTTVVDFGFNFDLVVNTNNAGQGSLRQFIANANTLGGEASLAQAGFYRDAVVGNANPNTPLPAGKETSIFMIPDGLPHDGLRAVANNGPASQLTGGVAVIAPVTPVTGAVAYQIASSGTNVNAANTYIDGRTQSHNVGNTNAAVLGSGGTVGAQGTALVQLDGPEVQLSGPQLSGNGASLTTGLLLSTNSSGSGVFGLAVVGFSGTPNNTQGGIRLSGANNLIISQNVLGTLATSFTDPGENARSASDNIWASATTGSTISQNLIGFASGFGINASTTTSNLTISGNELASNGLSVASLTGGLDNILIRGANTTVSGNHVAGAGTGFGIDMIDPAGSATIEDNTVTGNSVNSAGATAELGGIRLYGPGSRVRRNVISGNRGSGILATNVNNQQTADAIISRNSISGNGFLGLDLVSTASGNSTGGTQRQGVTPFVTLNDDGDADSGANGLLNFPVLESATVVGPNLVVRGFAPAGALVEVFVAAPASANVSTTTGIDTRNFGQGQTFLFDATEGSAADADAATGSYSGLSLLNGFNPGSETNAARFSFTVPLSSLPAGVSLTQGATLLTATATVTGAGTSEFGGNVLLNAPPVANNVSNGLLNNNAGATTLAPGLSGATFGPGNAVASYTIVSLPSTGTLQLNDGSSTSAVTLNQVIPAASIGGLEYVPAASFGGNVTFQYTVTDQNGVGSLQNSNNGALATGPATYTIPVRAVADVATSVTPNLAGPINAGTGLNFAVTFTNAGPDDATGYVRTLSLTPGLTTGTGSGNVVISGAGGLTGTYNNGTGAVTFNQNPTTLANSANLNVTVTINAVPGALTAVTATTSTSVSGLFITQGADLGPNTASATVAVTAIADVTTTLTAATGQTRFIPGGTNSFTVTFRNAGPSPAAGATRTVTVPAGFTVAAAPGSLAVSGSTITYPAADPLAASSSVTSFTFQLTAPSPGVSTDYTLTSTATTTTNQGSNALADQATLALNVMGPGVGCSAAVYRTRQPSGSNFSVLERLDRSVVNGVITFTATQLYGLTDPAVGGNLIINGLSFNALDGYLYAVSSSSNALIRLGLDSYQNLGSAGTPNGINSSGADGAGTLYFSTDNTNQLTRLVVATRTTTTISLSSTTDFGDLAVSPIDGFIYATRFYNPPTAANPNPANGLRRIDPSTGAVTTLAPTGTLASSSDPNVQSVGSLFFDAAGTLYASTNEGTLVLFNTADGSVTDIGSITTAVLSDAASCATPPQRLDVVRSAAPPVVVTPATSATTPVTLAVTFTVRVRNTGPQDAPAVQINDFLNSAFAAGNPTRTISSGPTLVSGTPLTVNPGFNGQSDTRLLAGTDLLTPGQEATVSYTLQLTYANPGAVPRSVINTESLASSTGSANNEGYRQISGALVPPALVFAVDRSTNATALPATANADAPSSTPVSFADAPLPVELLAFEATATGADAALRWSTAQELNNARFEVERSIDGRRFELAGSVAGAGNSPQRRDYRYRDAGAARHGALLYYRLRQVDFNGSVSLSAVRTVRFGATTPTFSLTPNPVVTDATLNLTALPGACRVLLLDASGRQVRTWTLAGGQEHRLPLADLPAGVYLLRVAGTPGAQRLLKQ